MALRVSLPTHAAWWRSCPAPPAKYVQFGQQSLTFVELIIESDVWITARKRTTTNRLLPTDRRNGKQLIVIFRVTGGMSNVQETPFDRINPGSNAHVR
jgi:hypothetical protein